MERRPHKEIELTEGALYATEARYQEILDNAPAIIYVKDTDGRYRLINRAFEKVYGKRRDEILGRTDHELTGQTFADAFRAYDRRILASPDPVTEEHSVPSHDGRPLTLLAVAFPLRDADGSPHAVCGIATDITERKNAEQALKESEQRYRHAVSQADAVLYEKEYGQRRFTYVGERIFELTGYRPDEFSQEIWKEMLEETIMRGEGAGLTMEEVIEKTERGELREWRADYRIRTRSGETRWLADSSIQVYDENGTLRGALGILQDITERKNAEETIRWHAHHDMLTGLPNRVLFLDRLEQALSAAERRDRSTAVLFLDLDHFKHINDTLGHDAGDRLLQQIAYRLRDSLRPEDTIARIGGDEFNVLLPLVTGPDDATQVAARLLEALRPPVMVNGHDLYIGGSIGISLFPQDGGDPHTLLKHADIALYQAKGAGRGVYRLYAHTMNDAAVERLTMEKHLRRAIEQKEFVLLFQPKVEIATGAVIGIEALLRWQHPERGLLAPEAFLSRAEESGLIVPIDEWALREAARQAVFWGANDGPRFPVSVNLSGRQFRRPGIDALISETLAETGLDAHLLALEIKEAALMEAGESAGETLQALKRLGVGLSVDDFGTGNFSLPRLRRFPLDILSIDRACVENVHTQATDRAVVRALIELGHALGLRVVAEGVETQAQLDALRGLGCDAAQGHLIAPPMSADALSAYLR